MVFSPIGVLKFNVYSTYRGKPGTMGVGGVLRNCKDEFLLMFSTIMGVCDYNEAEVLAILKALRLFSRRYHGRLVVESDCLVRLLRCLNGRRLLGNFITIAMKLGR